jgi:hypothetical protein
MKSLKAITYIQETFIPHKYKSFNIRNSTHKLYLKLLKKGYDQTIKDINIDIQIFEFYLKEIQKIEKFIYKQYTERINLRSCSYIEAIRKIRNASHTFRSMSKMSRTQM